jgi:citrate synthase
MTQTPVQSGLEGVVAAQTRISGVDGLAGRLTIAGYAVEEFAPQATFEETAYLLWHDTPPRADQLADLKAALAARRTLPAITLELLRVAAERQVPAMDALRMATDTFSLVDDKLRTDKLRTEGSVGKAEPDAVALTLTAGLPTAVAAYWRLQNGLVPIAPRVDLDHAANYLYMLSGEVPGAERTRALTTYLNTVVDHGLNASTFAARVIIATQSDLISAIVGAIGALKGPLHGGAPGPALDMVFEIGVAERAEPYLRALLERGDRLMGFGHRVYKVRDPRADVLAAAAERLYGADGDQNLYALALHVERTALRLLEEYKPGRRLQTNVEFYTALLLHGLGLSADLFTPTFALGRVVGWIAHCREQQRLNRLIRPQSDYIGAEGRNWRVEGRG